MRYWKNQKGQCGTFENLEKLDDGLIETTKADYDSFVSLQPIPEAVYHRYEEKGTGKIYELRLV